MILFNLISHHIMFQNYFNYNSHLIFQLSEIQKSCTHNSLNKLANSRKDQSLCIAIASSNNFSNKLANEFLRNRHSNHFVYRNFWQKFINKYLQETIFISAVSPTSDNHINQLKASGLYIYQGNDYKNFLLKFSKGLLNGKIKVSLNNLDHQNKILINNKSLNYITYKWFKFFHISNFSLNNTHDNILFNKKIKYKSLPLFILINNKRQVIMSESSDKLIYYKNYSSLFIDLFKQSIIKNYSSKKFYTGLLFINPEDALEYKNYVISQCNQSTRSNTFQSVIANMNLYYKLLNVSYNDTEFRLIPDLTEVGKLLYQYRKYKNLSFDINQKHGFNYFQGQPIYLIKPIFVKDKNTNYKKKVNYSYSRKNDKIKYSAVFLNYQTAINAWEKFRVENSYYNLPSKPQIHVSNLETFIQKYKSNSITNQIIFIPSFKTYDFVKNDFNLKIEKNNQIRQIITNTRLYTKTVCQRLIWSLTSRQPINW